MNLKNVSWFMIWLLVVGSFAPFVTAAQTFGGATTSQGFSASSSGSAINTWQSSRPTFDGFYQGSFDTYWPILTQLEKDQCEAVTSDFIIGIPPGGCSPMVVPSDLLAEQNVPVFCQLSAIRVNPLIDVSTIKSISFKGDYPDEIAGISFHPARAAVSSYRTLIGDPIETNIGYVVIVLKRQPDERNLEDKISGMLTATISYDAQGAFGTGAAEYYLEPVSDNQWSSKADESSFWAGKGYLRVKEVDSGSATIEVMSSKDDVFRTVTLKEGETSSRIYYPGQYCTAALKLKLNKIDNSEDMARLDIDGDNYWVRKGSKLFGGKCSVRDLNVFPGGSGSVEIACSGEKTFSLSLGDAGVVLNNGTNVSVGIGGSLKGKDKDRRVKDYYLGYYGSFKDESEDKGFAVLFDSRVTEEEVGDVTAIYESGSFENVNEVEKALENKNIFKKSGKYSVIFEGGGSEFDISFIAKVNELSVGNYPEESGIPEYLEKARNATMELIENFPAEKKQNGEYWGEETLLEQIRLAGLVGNNEMQVGLIGTFLSEYPGSRNVEYLRDLRLKLERNDYGSATKSVFVNNNNYNVRVDGFASGGGAGDSVEVRFNGGSIKKLVRGGVYDGNGGEIDIEAAKKKNSKIKSISDIVPRLTVVDIDGSSAEFSYVWKDGEKSSTSSKVFSVQVGGYESYGGVKFGVEKTNVREVAYVSLVPEVRNTKSAANFTYNIEVEKRAIELSPETAKQRVKALNKSIADWEERVESLGKLVKGLKGACFAVSTFLTLKSMVSGFTNAASLARDKVMAEYEVKCKLEGAKGSVALQQCYSKYSEEIEAAINGYGSAVTAVNAKVKCAETSKTVSSGFLESKVIDSDAYVKELAKESCSGIKDGWKYYYNGTFIEKADLDSAGDYRAVMLREEACKDAGSAACRLATEEMRNVLADNVDRKKIEVSYADNIAATGIRVPPAVHPNRNAITAEAVSAKGNRIGATETNYLAQVRDPANVNTLYYVELTENGKIDKIYKESDVAEVEDGDIVNRISGKYKFYIPKDAEACSNQIKSPYVKYYEKANKQGFAAVVPFNVRDGWYAHVEASDYIDAEVPKAFWICNVGSDRIISDGVSGGDKCVRFAGSSDVPFTPCSKTSAAEVKRMYQKAEAAIREANKNGNGITVDGTFVAKTSPLAPASSGAECSDFMDVQDCNLMFNVCDPVICPSSRCNMGGMFPVADVVSTGIIGSIALCLPNFGTPSEGGVLIPVCLTGIHAGLDSYVQILKSQRDCLEKNIETGEYIGICDEITAIHMCEFFWGQLSPIMDVLMVRFVERLYGGFQTKGGAEYLTIQKAFDNTQKSVDYFQSTYAQNAFRAFQMKNTEEIGGTVCNAFVGSSLPTSADGLDSLLEPESPTQFYAWFSEETFSEATVPATSHYKVFYHIYAGNDAGTQYRVYLKSPPESSYYSARQSVLVDSGYAAKGASRTESIDFTLPTGYKELCVDLNGREECGFGSVTSDFGLNYASQQYTADQAEEKDISTTEDCVTTSASAWGLVDPNLQEGAKKLIDVPGGAQTDISTTGIVRICASSNPEQGIVGGNDVYCKPSLSDGLENPGCAAGNFCEEVGGDSGVEIDVGVCKGSTGNQVSSERWVDVGYCDIGTVRCWLDRQSVKDNLGTYMAVNNLTSVNSLVMNAQNLKELNEEYKTVRAKLIGLREDIAELDLEGKGIIDMDVETMEIIEALDEVAGVKSEHVGQGANVDKAEALALKASVYMTIVRALVKEQRGVVESSGKVSESVVKVFGVESTVDGEGRLVVDMADRDYPGSYRLDDSDGLERLFGSAGWARVGLDSPYYKQEAGEAEKEWLSNLEDELKKLTKKQSVGAKEVSEANSPVVRIVGPKLPEASVAGVSSEVAGGGGGVSRKYLVENNLAQEKFTTGDIYIYFRLDLDGMRFNSSRGLVSIKEYDEESQEFGIGDKRYKFYKDDKGLIVYEAKV